MIQSPASIKFNTPLFSDDTPHAKEGKCGSSASSFVKWGILLLSVAGRVSRVGAEPQSLRGASSHGTVLTGLQFELPDAQRDKLESQLVAKPDIDPSDAVGIVDGARGNIFGTILPTLSPSSDAVTPSIELKPEDTPESFQNMTSYLSGERSHELAPAGLLVAAREYLMNNPLPEAAESLSPFEAHLFAFMKNELVKQTALIPLHVAWHTDNGPGGTLGPSSGEKFMSFHRGMLNDVKQFLGGLDQTIPAWTQFNRNITRIIPMPEGVERGGSSFSSVEPFEKPSFLTSEGGADATMLDGRNITSLEAIATPDELGRVIGMEFHGIGHGVIGGTMSGFESPRDPIFDTWHGALDSILTEWVGTDAGQRFVHTDEGQNWLAQQDTFTGLQSLSPSQAPSNAPSNSPSIQPSKALSDTPSDIPSDRHS